MEINIEGYDQMTPEQKVEAMEAFVQDYDPVKNGYVAKAAFDKASHEASQYKKQVKSTAEAGEQTINDLKSQIQQLQKDRAVDKAAARYVGLGYDAESAGKAAEALLNGDTDTLFELQSQFNQNLLKNAQAKAVQGMKKPASGSTTGNVDYSKLINEAQESGNISALAYYTRLSQEQKE